MSQASLKILKYEIQKKNKSKAFSDFSAKHDYFSEEWEETVNRIMTFSEY